MNIYAQSPARLTRWCLAILLMWTVVSLTAEKKKSHKKAFRCLNFILTCVAVYGILYYTVIGRTSSHIHEVAFAAPYSSEFFREMFMNALLFFPFGLAASAMIGLWSMPVAFVLSLGIEVWQYTTGSGLAQGTDVICNTLGAAIGMFPYLLTALMKKCADRKAHLL